VLQRSKEGTYIANKKRKSWNSVLMDYSEVAILGIDGSSTTCMWWVG
jgi:hypothetical protein